MVSIYQLYFQKKKLLNVLLTMNLLCIVKYLNQQTYQLIYLNSGIQIVWLEIAVLDPLQRQLLSGF